MDTNETGRPRSLGAIARHPGGWLPLLAGCALIGTAATLALPTVLGHAVDAIVAGSGGRGWVWLALAIIATGALTDLADSYASAASLTGTTAWLRRTVVRHLLALGARPKHRFDTGDLVTRVSANCVDAARAGPSLVAAAAAILPTAGSLVMLAVIDVRLALAFLAATAGVAIVLRLFTTRTAAVMADYQHVQGRIAARLTEALAGARTIAAAGTLHRETDRILTELPLLSAHGRRTWRVLATTAAQAAVAGPLVLISVLAVGGLGLWQGRLTPGELFAAAQYATIGAGLGGLTGIFAALARSLSSARRVLEPLGLDPAAHGTRELPDPRGELEFRAVTVRRSRPDDAAPTEPDLPPSEPAPRRSTGTAETGPAGSGLTAADPREPLLDTVDLRLPAGRAIAVVGDATKSIVADLAARLRDPDAGQVLLDGISLSDLPRHRLRELIGHAPAEPVLVGCSIAQALGHNHSRASIEAAAGAACCHAFIARLPSGYDTPLAEVPMSGGERQRLGLARAWPAACLLVLDDATSSLDTVTELRITRALFNGDKRTRLIVTHRAATAARADHVVWLAGGRVRGTGTHKTLWTDPDYREVFG